MFNKTRWSIGLLVMILSLVNVVAQTDCATTDFYNITPDEIGHELWVEVGRYSSGTMPFNCVNINFEDAIEPVTLDVFAQEPGVLVRLAAPIDTRWQDAPLLNFNRWIYGSNAFALDLPRMETRDYTFQLKLVAPPDEIVPTNIKVTPSIIFARMTDQRYNIPDIEITRDGEIIRSMSVTEDQFLVSMPENAEATVMIPLDIPCPGIITTNLDWYARGDTVVSYQLIQPDSTSYRYDEREYSRTRTGWHSLSYTARIGDPNREYDGQTQFTIYLYKHEPGFALIDLHLIYPDSGDC